ncbi:MAG: alpha/beta hydrolase [Alphaproteobacteria bacterium]|nr:alpha/beta hydrolase [Alphaproteobacteria bacterium]MBV9692336.1 alpha/beta hydrolase [Alphaproteobacteria bacterium]
MAFFESQGFSLAYDEIAGDGRPVVLIHGFASNRAENWKRLGWYGAFERRGMRMAALDLRGHGESAKPHEPGAYARSALAADVVALLDRLGAERADLVGYSLGARVAVAAALLAPKRFPLLVLGGVGGRLFEPAPPGTPMAEAMEADDPESIPNSLLRSFRRFADEQKEDRLALAAMARQRDESLTRDIVGHLAMPVLVVAGSRDELAGDPGTLAAAIPGARSVTLPGCDHFSAIPHALFKAAVFDFLDGVLE